MAPAGLAAQPMPMVCAFGGAEHPDKARRLAPPT